jgi:WD40 repeat protein
MNTLTCILELLNGNILTGGSDGSLKFWDLKTQKCCIMTLLNCHTGRVTCISELSSGLILTCADDCSMKIWNIDNFDESKDNLNKDMWIAKFNFRSSVSLKTSSTIQYKFISNETLKNGNRVEEIYFTLPFSSKKNFEETSEHDVFVTCIEELNYIDGKKDWVFGFNNGHLISMYPPSITAILGELVVAHSSSITCIKHLKNGLIITSSTDNSVKLWQLDKKLCLATFNEQSLIVTSLAELKNGDILLGLLNGFIKILNINTKICTTIIEEKSSETKLNNIIEIENRELISVSDGELKLWNLQSNKLIATLTNDNVNCILKLKSGDIISGSSSNQNILKIWDIKTRKCVLTINNNQKKNNRKKSNCLII